MNSNNYNIQICTDVMAFYYTQSYTLDCSWLLGMVVKQGVYPTQKEIIILISSIYPLVLKVLSMTSVFAPTSFIYGSSYCVSCLLICFALHLGVVWYLLLFLFWDFPFNLLGIEYSESEYMLYTMYTITDLDQFW